MQHGLAPIKANAPPPVGGQPAIAGTREEVDMVTTEEPRIGVYVCHCGFNISATVDVEAVRDIAADRPDVVSRP